MLSILKIGGLVLAPILASLSLVTRSKVWADNKLTTYGRVALGGTLLAGILALVSDRLEKSQRDNEDERQQARHQALLGKLSQVEAALKPFQKFAEMAYPELAPSDALARLQTEIAKTKELATRDIRKEADATLIASVREHLGAWRRKHSDIGVSLVLGNYDAEAVKVEGEKLFELLRSGGLLPKVATAGIMGGTPRGLFVVALPANSAAAHEMAMSLGGLIKQVKVESRSPQDRPGDGLFDPRAGTIVIRWNGVPLYSGSGTFEVK